MVEEQIVTQEKQALERQLQQWQDDARKWRGLYEEELARGAVQRAKLLDLEEESRQWEKARLVEMVHEIGRLKLRLQKYEPT